MKIQVQFQQSLTKVNLVFCLIWCFLGNLTAQSLTIDGGEGDPDLPSTNNGYSPEKKWAIKQYLSRYSEWTRVMGGMQTNDAQISDARARGDPIERYRVSFDIRQKSQLAVDFADAFAYDIARWNKKHLMSLPTYEIREKRQEYSDYQQKVERAMPAIKEKADRELKKHEQATAPNEVDRKRADETNDPLSRYCVRLDIIERTRKAVEYAERYSAIVSEDQNRIERYRNYQKAREEELPAIKASVYRKLKKLDREMAPNDLEIDNADKTKDLLEQLRVHLNIFERSKRIAEYSHRFTTVTGEDHDRMKRFRNYQHKVESGLKEIKSKIYQQLEQFDKEKNKYESKIDKVDTSKNMNKQIKVRQNILPNIKNAADYSHKFTTIAEEDHDRMRRLRDFQHKVERDLLMISKQEKQEPVEIEPHYGNETIGGVLDLGPEGNGLDDIVQDNEIMSLKEINVDIETGDLTFILSSESCNVVIPNKLNLIQQYIAQKHIEGKGLRETSWELPNIDPDKLLISGLEGESDDIIKLITLYVADVRPSWRTKKSITEFISNNALQQAIIQTKE